MSRFWRLVVTSILLSLGVIMRRADAGVTLMLGLDAFVVAAAFRARRER